MSARHARGHAALTDPPCQDDELTIGGVPTRRLAERVGRTPFYAYDRSAISHRVAALRAAMPTALSLHYAIKANPMPAVVAHLAARVDGLDVASAGELQRALDTGTPPERISFAGPGKRDAELHAAVAAGVTLNVESPGEIERLAGIASALGVQPRVAVRVNPDYTVKSSGMTMGGGARPFGVDAEAVPALLHRIHALDLDFRGFHIFSGSQNLQVDSLIEVQSATFELAWRLAADAPAPIASLNIGGGLGIPYFPGEMPLALAPLGEHLAGCMETSRERIGDAEIVVELGRYLVGEAGVYICRVIERKVSRGTVFLVTDGGLHHHLAATGNFGQILRRNYPVCLAHRVHGGPRETATVVGPLCTPLDCLADGIELARAEPGDLIAVLQSGAYGYTASPHAFLDHPPPVEVLV